MLGARQVDLAWTGDVHDSYEIHIGTVNSPSSIDGWNSGQVASTANTATTPALATQRNWFLFVRLHDAQGWGPWNSATQSFYIAGEWLNSPYLVNPTGMWPQNTAFNPARNEYLVAYRTDDQSIPRMTCYRLDSTAAHIGSPFTIVDPVLSGSHEGVIAYNSVNAEYLVAYSGWVSEGGDQSHDAVRLHRINAATGAHRLHSSPVYRPQPGRGIRDGHRVFTNQ